MQKNVRKVATSYYSASTYKELSGWRFYYFNKDTKLIGLWMQNLIDNKIYSAKEILNIELETIFHYTGITSNQIVFHCLDKIYQINPEDLTYVEVGESLAFGAYNGMGVYLYNQLSDEWKAEAYNVIDNIQFVNSHPTQYGWKLLYASEEAPIKGVWLCDGLTLYLVNYTDTYNALTEYTNLREETNYYFLDAEDGHYMEIGKSLSLEVQRFQYNGITIIRYDSDADMTYDGIPVSIYILDHYDEVTKIECGSKDYIYEINGTYIGFWSLAYEQLVPYYVNDLDNPPVLISQENGIYIFESDKYRVTIDQNKGSHSRVYIG